ncbi:MAG: hypothetical protein ACOZIN_02450 [Myxococcota bacterium]
MTSSLGRALCLGALFLPLAVLAEGPKVEVLAEVVLASMEGNLVDPPSLAPMQKKLAQRKKYGSLRRLSVQKVVVAQAPSQLRLPNEKVATFQLKELKEGVAKVEVKVPPLSTVYTLGREGSLYQAAGEHQGGDLWLVLSSSQHAQPRRAPARRAQQLKP